MGNVGIFGTFGGALTGDFGLLGDEPPIEGPDLGAEGLLGDFNDDPEKKSAKVLYLPSSMAAASYQTYHQHSKTQTICLLRRLPSVSAKSQVGCNGSGRWRRHRAALLRRGRAWSYRTQGVGVFLPFRVQASSFPFFPKVSIECSISISISMPPVPSRTAQCTNAVMLLI